MIATQLKRLAMVWLLAVSLHSYGQKVDRDGLSGGIDLGVGFRKGVVNPSITYYELISLGRSESFYIGWTGRLNALYGTDLNYYTAPARLTRGASGLGSLGKPLRNENIDTVRFDRVSPMALNLGVRAEYYVGPITLGASVDLIGVTLIGGSRTGFVQSSTGLFNVENSSGGQSQVPFQGGDAYQRASPQRLNLRALGDLSRGMLTSEVYARIRFTEGVSLKVGYQWLTSEVVLSNKDVVANNNRYRNRSGLFSAGLTFPLTPW